MSMDGQGTKRRRKNAENFNRLSRVHERYRRQTDGRRTAIEYSEREREFTFAKSEFWGAPKRYECVLDCNFVTTVL